MLDAEVDALLDVSMLNLLIDDNADCGSGDVVNDSGFAVVDFMGHAAQN